MPALPADVLDQLFHQARTHNAWVERPLPDELLHELYDLVRMAPTSANSSPARFVFVKSTDAKERLRPAVSPGNVDKTMSAPVTAIVAYDLEFAEQMTKLSPTRDMKSWIVAATPEFRADMAKTNATLELGYLILAARALGLDCGPMAGVNGAKVDEAFFAGTSWRSLMLVNLGYGDASKVYPRNPRLDFAEVARIE